jgi:hypothetical protein
MVAPNKHANAHRKERKKERRRVFFFGLLVAAVESLRLHSSSSLSPFSCELKKKK